MIIDQALQRILGERLKASLDYYSEHIDAQRFTDAGFQAALHEFLRRKYADRQFDVLVATTDAALELATIYSGELFAGVPVIFYATSPVKPRPGSTGLTSGMDLARTIGIALQLQPETQRVFVLTGRSPFDKFYETLSRAQFRQFEGRLEIVYWSGLPMPELLDRVARLPAHSIVYPLFITEDGNGQRFLPLDPIDSIVAAANAPTYGFAAPELDRGIVGGSLYHPEIIAARLAELTLRVLDGEAPADIPVASIDPFVNEVDWRELQRWNISEARVPAGTVVRFREPGLWVRYKRYIIATLILILAQTALIAGLLVQRVKRRRIESALRESEESFRVMADTAPVMVWRSGTDKACDFFNRPWLEFRGRSMDQEIGDGWTQGVHAADLEACIATYAASFDERRSFRMEYRLQRADGEHRWVLDSGVPRVAPDGSFAGYIGSCIDITERQRAEAELRDSEAALRRSLAQNQDLAGRLIVAQEAERARIARDLHDDMSQRLAGVAMMLSGLKGRLGMSAPEKEIASTLTEVQECTNTVADGIRNLSHELHAGALQFVGLAGALKEHCSEFERHRQIRVPFSTGDTEIGWVDPSVALCLYRVTQEALANAARHGRAQVARVRLVRTVGALELGIVDDGIGFDANQHHGSGLGLRSIAERVRLVHGIVKIESQPGRGTSVVVSIPNADHTHGTSDVNLSVSA
jgi:PAS domain S-box-containing protein